MSGMFRRYSSSSMRAVRDRIAVPLILVAVLLLGFIWLLHYTGAWGRVVDATEQMFGSDVAEQAEALGDKVVNDPGSLIDGTVPGGDAGTPGSSDGGSAGGGEGATQYVPETLPDTVPGDDTQIDWGHVREQLGQLAATDQSAAQRIEPYDRDRHFGDWVDHNGDGCREDDEVRLRDATAATIEPGTVCAVQTGVLHDPYSGADVPFDRAVRPLAVEVEHIVSLHDIYYSGGWRMSQQERVQISHDLERELVLVSRVENQAKKQKTPAEWMPSDPAAWCWYAASYIDVKATYGLTVDDENRHFLGDVISACAG